MMAADRIGSIEETEKSLQATLEDLSEKKIALEHLEEEVLESAEETNYHLNQVLTFTRTPSDTLVTNDIIDSVRRYMRDIDAHFEERKTLLKSQEEVAFDALEDIRYQKRMEFARLEEEKRKEKIDG